MLSAGHIRPDTATAIPPPRAMGIKNAHYAWSVKLHSRLKYIDIISGLTITAGWKPFIMDESVKPNYKRIRYTVHSDPIASNLRITRSPHWCKQNLLTWWKQWDFSVVPLAYSVSIKHTSGDFCTDISYEKYAHKHVHDEYTARFGLHGYGIVRISSQIGGVHCYTRFERHF